MPSPPHPTFHSRQALLLALLFALTVFSAQTMLAWKSPVRGADLNAYLVGSVLLQRGEDPYTFDKDLWKQIAEEDGLQPVTGPYRYPIHLAWVLQSVSDVDPRTLWIVNASLNVLAALLGTMLTAMALGGGWLHPLAILLVGIAGAMGETILLGQVTGYILLALGGGQLALQRMQPIRFACFVSLGTILKLLPGLLILIAVVSRRYRLASIATVTTLALFALPILDLGIEHLTRYLGDLGSIITLHDFRENNQSLEAAFHRWDLPRSFTSTAKFMLLASFVALCFTQWRRPSTTGAQAVLSAGLCLALLIPTSAFFLYQPWLIFPILFVFRFLYENRQVIAAIVLIAAYILIQILFVLPQLLVRAWPSLMPGDYDPYGWLGEWPALYCALLFVLACRIGFGHEPQQDSTPSDRPRIT